MRYDGRTTSSTTNRRTRARRRECAVELVEDWIDGRLERVCAVENGDLHGGWPLGAVDRLCVPMVHYYRRSERGELDQGRRFETADAQVETPRTVSGGSPRIADDVPAFSPVQ